MIRLRQLLRNPQVFFRISSPLGQRSDLAHIRHVRFRRPWIRKFLSTCLIYGAAFHIWSSFVLLQFDDTLPDVDAPQESATAHRDGNEGDEEHLEAEAVEEDPIFIPLGWPRLRMGELYAAEDPEWKEFVRISRDRQRLQSLKDELATMVLRSVSQTSQIPRALGNPLTVTDIWLVHHFPSRAPPGYERSGLEVREGTVSWVSRPMSPENGDKLRRSLQPMAMTLAMKDAYVVFLKRQLERFTNLIGFSQTRLAHSPDPPQETRTLPSSSRSDGSKDASRPHLPVQTSNGSPRDMSQEKQESPSHSSAIISSLQRLPLPEFGPGSDLYEASVAFKKRLRDSRARERRSPRPGVFLISGPVGLKGPKGFCRVEVVGEYDPKTATWPRVSMRLKDWKRFEQRPLGRQ